MSDDLARAILYGNRRALARAVTLVESDRADHRAEAIALLRRLAGSGRRALRIGLSGAPGVGKSTFVETFGLMLAERGLRVAVLAVDPSSARSGGSILGDKTRMERLAREPRAFIRPSPARGELGGVARRSREVIALVEAAKFDVVIVETVGVGQSETLVSRMTDIFALLIAPGGGDELQGVKRGIMEHADLILVNKADGALETQAAATCADYAGALRLLRRRDGDAPGYPKALTVSAIEATGVAEAWREIETLARHRRETGHLDRLRAAQNRHWFEEAVRHGLLARLDADPEARALRDRLGAAVAAGCAAPSAAAAEMLDALARLPSRSGTADGSR